MIISLEELKKLLINNNLIDEITFKEIHKESQRLNINILDLLFSQRLLDKDYYANILSDYLKVKRINLKQITIPKNILRLIPEKIVLDKKIIPFKEENGILHLAMINPNDYETINFIANLTHKKIEPYLVLEDEFQFGLTFYQKLYQEEYEDILKNEISQIGNMEITEEIQNISAAKIIDNLLSYAVGLNTSDIHIEIFYEYSLIRFRIDGILKEIMKLPKKIHSSLIARIKILANLQIDEHFRPQDGRFKTKLGDFEFDIRVSIIPTIYGEKAVLRLLASTFKPSALSDLGLNSFHEELIKKAIKKSYGMIISTGPTGSGKTTTLYTIIQLLNSSEVNICTIEDPIEYELPRVNQMQVNPKINLSFAEGLRALLRQDPNIIMVGEIRDYETADIAVQSALTGHLILTTLHTNDAISSIPRLLDLKIPKYLVASTLSVVIAQRLVRKICLNCIYSTEIKNYQIETIKEQLSKDGLSEKEINEYPITKYLFKGKGCELCSYSGYRGRTGIFEIFFMDDELIDYLARKEFNLVEFKSILKRKNYKTMFQDGLEKLTVGIASLEEILRVIRE
ncbi:MAG: GspE/PulE family protein [Patescibacteria group bacterium]|nr:GspE/PulE family protein [Patescibacteria group bacterium]